MSDLIFEIFKIVVMACALLVTRYFIPWIKEKIGSEKLSIIAKWAKTAVLAAEQTMESSSGTDRKTTVTQFLKQILTAKNISLTDSQLDSLIEAAVKEMNIETGKTASVSSSAINTIINTSSEVSAENKTVDTATPLEGTGTSGTVAEGAATTGEETATA